MKDINEAVREVCLSFPEAVEVPSRGSPDFRVAKKTFATYVVNHHGDGRIALWLRSPDGAQPYYTESDPDNYFVPPYVGPKGWLGVHLDRDLSWDTIATRVREAYEAVAPASLSKQIGATVSIEPPTVTLDPEQVDPMNAPRAQEVWRQVAELCAGFPETEPGTQFGSPTFKAGKKTFVSAHRRRGRMALQFWVGPERQSVLSLDDRYTVPPYIGHRGWIELDVEERADHDEIHDLLDESYRHFALKRMLKALDGI